jgi:hypothetical protein
MTCSDVTPYLLVGSWHVGIQSPLTCFHLWHTRPQRNERSKPFPFSSFSFSFFVVIFHRLTIHGNIIRRSVMPGSYSITRSTIFFFSLSSGNLSSHASTRLFLIVFSCCALCGVCVVSIPCSCACGYPVLILIDEPSPTVLDSDTDRVSRRDCLLISRGVYRQLETK